MTDRCGILVLRSDDAFSSRLRESGFEVVNLELIEIVPVEDTAEVEERLATLDGMDGLIFTSPYAAKVFLAAVQRAGHAFPANAYVLGERTKRVFENAGISVNYRPDANTAAEMIASFGEEEFAGKHMLFVRGDRSMRTIPELLAGKADIDELVVYRTIDRVPDEGTVAAIKARLKSNEIAWSCFFSPSAVDVFCRVFAVEEFGSLRTAAIGTTTALRAKEAGLNISFVSQRARAYDFAAELIEYIKSN